MAVRDDSVIRGSLIACSIFLFLSLVLNFLLWRMGDTSSTEATSAKSQLQDAQLLVQKQTNQIGYLKAVIGVDDVTEAELGQLAEACAGDASLEKVIAEVATSMTYFGPEVDVSRKNLTALPEYLVGVIRERATQYTNVSQLLEKEKQQAASEINIARTAQKTAEDLKQKSEDEKERLRTQFETDRKAMNLAKDQLQDVLTRQNKDHLATKGQLDREISTLKKSESSLIATVDLQRREINTLRNSEFEVAQGEVTYTRPGDRLVQINLGAADALRNGVNFAVFDRDKTGVTNADPKAMVEVVSILGDHLAEARILGDRFSTDPIIAGDKIYSPFWAPGRKVRIALAGSIDVNNNGKGDEEDISILTGIIQAAGAEVAAVVGTGGPQRGRRQKLDAGIRFLVVGERPEVSAAAQDVVGGGRQEQELAQIGEIIDEARQLGITIIPAEKLLGFLKTIDDSLTVPLGNTARASDFKPLPSRVPRRVEGDMSGLFKDGEGK
jgi:cob(I)alamin adenosyltransferase